MADTVLEQEYYILSLKWTKGIVFTWWCPSNNGYTIRLASAGRYSASMVAAHPAYYNDGENTMAIPCEVVDAHAELTVLGNCYGELKAAALPVTGPNSLAGV